VRGKTSVDDAERLARDGGRASCDRPNTRNGNEITTGYLAFTVDLFARRRLTGEGDGDPILQDLAAQVSQELDANMVDELRKFRFGARGGGGFELTRLNLL
jgi:hypothetical protein